MPYLDPSEVTDNQIQAEIAAYADLLDTEGTPVELPSYEYDHKDSQWVDDLFATF